MDKDPRAQNDLRRRQFYLYMSPFEGHDLAQKHGNFEVPSRDVLEAEVKDILTSWLTIQQSSVGQIVADSAWWMLRLMDPDNSKGAEESMLILDGLTSFGMSLLGQALANGLISLSEDVEIPDIVTSAEGMLSDSDFDLLSQIEALWEETHDDE